MTLQMYQKNAIALMYIAVDFLGKQVDDKTDTIAELTEKLGVARGTVQKAIKILEESGAVSLEARGQLGTIIKKIDYNKLIKYTGLNSIVGVMPLPYSDKYEGLATGICKTLNQTDINANLAFMSGSEQRIKALLDERYDFCVLSLKAALYYLESRYPVEIAVTMNPHTYVEEHRLIVRKDFSEIFDGMKIGIDTSSFDQVSMTNQYFNERKVEMVPLKYSHIIDNIKNKTIDGTIWSYVPSLVDDKFLKAVKIFNDAEQINNTATAIVTRSGATAAKNFIKKYFDKQLVEKIQQQVVNKEITPTY